MGKKYELSEYQKRNMPQLFKPGVSGNPSGGNSVSMRRNHRNAIKAAELREKFLETLESRIATVEVVAQQEAAGDVTQEMLIRSKRVMELLNGDVNRLLTDSENRGFGAPRSIVDIEDRRDRRPEDYTDDELAQIAAETPQMIEDRSGEQTE